MVGTRILVDLYRCLPSCTSIHRALDVDVIIPVEALVGDIDDVRIRIIHGHKSKGGCAEGNAGRLRIIDCADEDWFTPLPATIR